MGAPKTNIWLLAVTAKKKAVRSFIQHIAPFVRGTAKAVSGVKIRITEGVLKADLATALDEDTYCIGMHGLNIPNDLANLLEELEISELVISLDSGEDKNPDMIRTKKNLIALAKEIGIDHYVEVWDTKYGKGVDDVLATGNADKIRYATEEELNATIGPEDKPVITVFGGGLSDHATEGEKALIDAGLDIYQRSKKLVTPIKQKTFPRHRQELLA